MAGRHDDRGQRTADSFLRGLRTGVLVIAAAVLIPSGLVRHIGIYRPLWVQFAGYTALAAVVVVETVLLAQRRSWGAVRWPALVVVYTASVAAILSIPAEDDLTAANWVFGVTGWSILVLVAELPLPWLCGFLGLHELIVAGIITGLRDTDRAEVLNLAVGSIGAVGFPLAAGLAVTALRRVSAVAERAADEAERVRTADEVAALVHEDRRRRYSAFYDTTVPLLRGLAEGSVDPHRPEIQRMCAIEAARMRRLFAETDDAPDALLHELRHGADVAERRAVMVELETRGRWGEPPVAVRRALTDGPLAVLASASTHARVTVVGSPDAVSVSVIGDCGELDLRSGPAGDDVDDVVVLTARDPEHDQTWVEARWTPHRSAR